MKKPTVTQFFSGYVVLWFALLGVIAVTSTNNTTMKIAVVNMMLVCFNLMMATVAMATGWAPFRENGDD